MRYECETCGGDRRKLWRVAASSHIRLWCAACICEQTGVPPSEVHADGTWPCTMMPGRRTDQVYVPASGVPNLVPAIPDLDGEWWGYTSVPPEWVAWWKALPLGALVGVAG